jgi:pimeloyl-ACP methyl ester carboxylesterase
MNNPLRPPRLSSGMLVRAAALIVSLAVPELTLAQAPAAVATRMVDVGGRAMRVQTRGLESRRQGQAIILLEAGAATGLDTWAPIADRVALLAPVVAYDRRGLGRSALDDQPQTLARASVSLHQLLAAIDVPPPYVLVGHSYGGVIIRAFAQRFSSEVVGLVYIDTPDIELTYAEVDQIGPAGRQVAFAPPVLSPTVPAGVKAEVDNISQNLKTEFAEARAARPPESIPSAVVISTQRTWNGATPEMSAALLRLVIKHQQDWAMSTSKGLVIVASHVGHLVHRDDPDLVLRLIRQVLPT